jgi:hypothetical protein
LLSSFFSLFLSGVSLTIQSNEFVAADALDWKDIFSHMTQIHTLDLSDNQFSDNGVAHILDVCRAISECESLVSLRESLELFSVLSFICLFVCLECCAVFPIV